MISKEAFSFASPFFQIRHLHLIYASKDALQSSRTLPKPQLNWARMDSFSIDLLRKFIFLRFRFCCRTKNVLLSTLFAINIAVPLDLCCTILVDWPWDFLCSAMMSEKKRYPFYDPEWLNIWLLLAVSANAWKLFHAFCVSELFYFRIHKLRSISDVRYSVSANAWNLSKSGKTPLSSHLTKSSSNIFMCCCEKTKIENKLPQQTLPTLPDEQFRMAASFI